MNYGVYEIITDGITLTYPIGGEKLVAGSQTVVHWDSQNAINTTQIELSEDNGATWTSLATLPPASRNYTWTVPNNLVSGECLIRVSNGSFTDQSGATYSNTHHIHDKTLPIHKWYRIGIRPTGIPPEKRDKAFIAKICSQGFDSLCSMT